MPAIRRLLAELANAMDNSEGIDIGIGLKTCEQLGCCEVEVSTEKTNVTATRFYRKCGFEERGTLFEVDL